MVNTSSVGMLGRCGRYWEPGVADKPDKIYVTIAMAEILLGQSLVDEAGRVVEKLRAQHGNDERVKALCERIEAMSKQAEPVAVEPAGKDSVKLSLEGKSIRARWEVTDNGLALAKNKARYSGHSVLRLFSAVPGPRGVRTSFQDIEVSANSAQMELKGLPCPAVHVAAVGYLSNTGEFVPLAESDIIEVGP